MIASSLMAVHPFFESYWESWDVANPTNYCSQLEDVPAGTGIGKVNVVSIAFGDFTFARDDEGSWTIGYVNDRISVQDLKNAIHKIHLKGGKIKLSLGGGTFSMSSVVKTQDDAEKLARNIAAVCQQDELDGIDFDIEDRKTSPALQLYLYRRCRELLGPNALISYTIPARGEWFAPWSTVIKNAVQYFSSINVMCYDHSWSEYDPKQDFAALQSMGVPASKIVWGLMLGRVNYNEYLTVAQVKEAASYVKQNGLGGVMMWDLNRDSNHRTGYRGKDSLYQAGQPDGTYLNAISAILNSDR